MVPPFLSSAQLAQELRRAAATACEQPSPMATASSRVKPRFLHEHAGDSSSSESEDQVDDDSESDDDDASLIEEHFLPPLSEEATWCKAFTYARVLSSIGQQFATEFPLRVLAVASGFSESLNGDIHTVRALDGRKELAISHSRLTPEQAQDVAAFLARREHTATDALSSLALDNDDADEPAAPPAPAPAPTSPSRRARTRTRPSASTPPSSAFPGSAPFPPGATSSERAELEAVAARYFGDSLLSGLSSLAATPQRARSPSPGPSAEREAREELLEWYQHAGPAAGRQGTAQVGDEDELARDGWAIEPPLSVALEGGAPVLRVPAAVGVNELAVYEEVETEEDEELRAMVARVADDEAEAEAALREREQQEQQEAVGR